MESQTNSTPCPYLGTIRRHLLDFDFEKVCCISLSNTNVYGCLVCGRYFQGKGKNTYAYTHSLEENHHLFMNLENGAVYCLPDGYEVNQPSLDDIRYNLLPTYKQENSRQIDENIEICENLDDKAYIPGCVGLNNLKNTQYVNVIVQMLSRVREIRDIYMFGKPKGKLSEKFSMLLKKMWNNKNFKGVVSPHEFIQALSEASQKKFKMGQSSDPLSLLLWTINNLELQIKQNKVQAHILSRFRGRLKTSFFKARQKSAGYEQLPSKVEQLPFLMLSVDVPMIGKQQSNPNMLNTLLERYLGKTPQDTAEGRKFFLITSYPQYLIVNFKRFTYNGFFKQKNPIIVLFPLQMEFDGHLYRLIANICHQGNVDSNIYKIQVRRASNWYVMHDLHVQRIRPEEVIRSQAYIQLYEKA